MEKSKCLPLRGRTRFPTSSPTFAKEKEQSSTANLNPTPPNLRSPCRVQPASSWPAGKNLRPLFSLLRLLTRTDDCRTENRMTKADREDFEEAKILHVGRVPPGE